MEKEKTPIELKVYIIMGVIISFFIWIYLISFAFATDDVLLAILIVFGSFIVFFIANWIIPIILMYLQFFVSDTLRWFLEH